MKEIAKTESLVDAYKINKPLKLNTVNKGESIDNVLVHGVDNEVKSVPRSEFSGSSQTIDKVLEAGNTAVDKWLTINSYAGQPTVSIVHGRFVSLYNNFTGDKASLQNNQLFVSDKEDTVRTTIFNNGIQFDNPQKRATLMANPDSELLSIGKVLLPPIANDSSVKTLTATDDFKTINGNSIIGVGDITIEGGGEIPTLQEVFAKTPNSTYGAYSANDRGAKTQFVIGVDDGGFQEARIDGAVAVSSKSGSLGVYNGEVNFSQYSNGGQSSLSFTAPIATGGAANFKIPAKLTGDYILATTDDVNTKLTQNNGITTNSQVYAKQSDGSQTMLNISDVSISSNINQVLEVGDLATDKRMQFDSTEETTLSTSISHGGMRVNDSDLGMSSSMDAFQIGIGDAANSRLIYFNAGEGIVMQQNGRFWARLASNNMTKGVYIELPSVSGTLAASVNGNVADIYGAITVPLAVGNSTTSALNLSTLNTIYPSVVVGYRVQCMSIVGGGLIYEKTSTGWIQYPITTVL
ncbi:hypothetical protein [Flavobacterium hydatis]|uniref:Uncharacterized protein n=1 Tax=Flavobacterium hydatis TaxID=991 RepID=A0A086A3H7_FLAHY|nr:hypothetical protein [Flavobacterium hydatis]KFF11241.1 hypothetical protein IW20_20140 [Flavobacterium hydatis]OXA97910.1 hypothetical protein B0A62_03365 [Flavobacterium hydatis]